MLFLGKLGGNRPKESLLGHTLPRARLPTRAWYGASWFWSDHLGIDQWSYELWIWLDRLDSERCSFWYHSFNYDWCHSCSFAPCWQECLNWNRNIRHWRGCRAADISQILQRNVCIMTITVGQAGHFLSIQWTSSNLLSQKTYGDHLTKCTLTIGRWLLWGAMVVVSVNNL